MAAVRMGERRAGFILISRGITYRKPGFFFLKKKQSWFYFNIPHYHIPKTRILYSVRQDEQRMFS